MHSHFSNAEQDARKDSYERGWRLVYASALAAQIHKGQVWTVGDVDATVLR